MRPLFLNRALAINPLFHAIRRGDERNMRGIECENADGQNARDQSQFALQRKWIGNL